MSRQLERAELLVRQGRYDHAERELRGALARDPQDAAALALLGHCQLEQERPDEAVATARSAIGADPQEPLGHHVLARAQLEKSRFKPATEAIREAIRLEPGNCAHWTTLGAIHLAQRQWDQALKAAERGLSFDADDVGCANIRALALVSLGRSDEAEQSVASALRKAPETAVSHANAGWTCLHRGDHVKAMEHFREALRLEPDMEWARDGLLQALRARHLIYRLLLKYLLWTARLDRRAAWGVILLSYFGFRALRSWADNWPEARFVLVPLLVIVGLAILLTWIGDAFFNLLLRASRYGRWVLNDRERAATNWLAGLLAAGVAIGALYGATGTEPLVLALIVTALLTIPATRANLIADERRRRAALLGVGAMCLAVAGGIAAAFAGLEGLAALLMLPVALASLGYQLLANWRAIHR